MTVLKYLFFAMAAVGLATLGACGGGSGSSTDDGDAGVVQLALTDAFDHSFSEVVISIKEVRAVPAGEEGAAEGGLPLIVSYDPPKVVNVLELAYQQEFLGEAVLAVGEYNQLRLVLESNTDPLAPANYLVMAEDELNTKIPLNTPSGQESGLKVVGKFDVAAGEITAVVIDFDPTRAVVEAGQSGLWLLKPTGIRVTQSDEIYVNYGAIIGTIAQAVVNEPVEEEVATEPVEEEVVTPDETQEVVVLVEGDSVAVTNAVVYALPMGSDTAIAAGSVNSEDGSFRLMLPGGYYALKVTAEGFEDYLAPGEEIPYYEVVTGQDTDAGTLFLTPEEVGEE